MKKFYIAVILFIFNGQLRVVEGLWEGGKKQVDFGVDWIEERTFWKAPVRFPFDR